MDSDSDGVPDAEDAYPNDPYRYLLGNVSDGADVWASSCTFCHGNFVNDGLTPGMNIDPDNLLVTDSAQLVVYIEQNMPQGGAANCVGQCAADVAEFVLTLEEEPVASGGDPVNGQALYNDALLNCSGCHGPTGNAGIPITPGNWTAETMTTKIENTMPAGNSAACTGTCAEDISAYIMSW